MLGSLCQSVVIRENVGGSFTHRKEGAFCKINFSCNVDKHTKSTLELVRCHVSFHKFTVRSLFHCIKDIKLLIVYKVLQNT